MKLLVNAMCPVIVSASGMGAAKTPGRQDAKNDKKAMLSE